MDKKPKKKPLFVMKETLVHLTPHQLGLVQGAQAGLVGEPGCKDYSCRNYTE